MIITAITVMTEEAAGKEEDPAVAKEDPEEVTETGETADDKTFA